MRRVLVVIPHNPIWVGSSRSIVEHPALKRKILLFLTVFDKLIVLRGDYSRKLGSIRLNYYGDKIVDVTIPYYNILLYSLRAVKTFLTLYMHLKLRGARILLLSFDHIHLFTLMIRLIAKILGIPIISFYVNTPTNVKEQLTYKLSKVLDNLSIAVHPVIALKLRLRKWILIPNIPDREFFRETSIEDRDRNLILVVSRLTPEKNVEVAVYIVSRLVEKGYNIKLAIIGDGPLRRKLEDLARRLNLSNNIVFLGHRPLRDVLAYMCKAGFLLHTSINEYFPNVIVEAMACNLPVITFSTQAYQWILGTSLNIPVKTKSITDIVDTITRLIDDDNMYRNRIILQRRRIRQILDIYLKNTSLLRKLLIEITECRSYRWIHPSS